MNKAMLDLRARLELMSKQYPMLSAVGAGIDKAIREIDAMLAAAPKPEAQAAGVDALLLKWDRKAAEHNRGLHEVDAALSVMAAEVAADLRALSTPASHDAQQDTSPEYRRGWLAGVESMRQELAQQPAVDDPEGSLRWLDRRIADMGGHDKTTETYQHYVNLRSMIRAQQPAVVGDAIRHLTKWLDAVECECEGGHRCGRDEVQRTRDQLAALTPAATPGEPEEYEFEVFQGGAWQAGGSAPDFATAQAEANHYAMMYGQDGPEVEVKFYARREVTPAQKEGNGNG